MNQIVIMYGKLNLKTFVIKIDELKLYYEDKVIGITKDKIEELLSILVFFKNNDYNISYIDDTEYDLLVTKNGEEVRYRGNNIGNLNKIKAFFGDLNVR